MTAKRPGRRPAATGRPASEPAAAGRSAARRPAASRPSAKRYVSPTINLERLDTEFSRADLEFHGLDHSGESYEARIFLNNPDADESTDRTLETGYAGSFHIFGHGGCFGDDPSHCEVTGPRRAYDPRFSHPLVPTVKVVIATDAIRRVLERGKEVSVTVVPIVGYDTDDDVLKFERLRIVTYR
jgi:hypothetical protein